ncbi:TPA: type VI secretion system protein, partial [Legionella pneumophila]|nr:type VI secretion system protein [Legionella pneumophila]HAT2137533.1 type VI secretion system protein [Legionella pneumophila]HAT2146792.1 type VI secretion system protein [Legionella pneumophila]HAT2161913.1 type VI secretion system protein [Legionella pneumophila]HAT3987350.1 type VI secretion system protein [Legionella pneumophila]
MLELDKIVELVIKPIDDKNSVGENCHDSESYILLRNEMQKISRVTLSSTIDWNKVINTSLYLLIEKSKDIQVACYLAYALFHQYRFKGLKIGVQFLSNLINLYWNQMYPKDRLNVKINFVHWYISQSCSFFELLKLDKEEKKYIEQSIYSLVDLKKTLLEHNVNIDAAQFLINRLTDGLHELQIHPEDHFIKEEKISSKVMIQDQSSSRIDEVDLTQGFLILTKRARELMREDLTKAYPYYLNRLAAWGGIKELPTMEDDGVSVILPPDYFNIKRINDVQSRNDLTEILLVTEEIIPQEPLWLDLQIISCDILQKLGNKYRKAFLTVKREFLHFLHRMPSIEKLKFNNGNSFLSNWAYEQLETYRNSSGMTVIDRMHALSEAEQGQIKEIEKIYQNINKKNFEQSIIQLEQINKQAVSERIRLITYLGTCRESMKFSNYTILKPNLFFALELIERHQLFTWEPILSLDALSLIYRGMRLIKNKISDEQLEHVINLIARIDTKMAIELT